VEEIFESLYLMRGSQNKRSLKQALGLRGREVVSLVGAGGKTSLMFLLGKELKACGYRVITTTTTKIFEPEPEDTPYLSIGESQGAVLAKVDLHGHVTVVFQRLAQRKVEGISSEQVDALWESGKIDYLIVEADGAAQRSLKAPEVYEPVIPPCTGIVVGLLAADAFDAVLNEAAVFRPHIFSRITGLPLGARLTYEAVIKAFTHRDGIIKGAPSSARVILFVNKVDLGEGRRKGREFARMVLDYGDSRIERVVLGQLRSDPPVVEIISNEW
jgi:probable selenium-dependent hydroxylase accessory protein YqeC